MPLIGKKISEIKLADLESLRDEKEREGKYLEYKRKLPGKSDEDKIEFCNDISAFANADGGDIIYGISEKKDRRDLATAIPDKLVGLSEVNPDHDQRRLENIAQTKIIPQFYGLQFEWVPIEEGSKILILRVPRSWRRPHAVMNNHDLRVYIRTQSGKLPVDFEEIKRMILSSGSFTERLSAFREKRIRALKNNTIEFNINPTAVIIHLIPLGSLESSYIFDAEYLYKKADTAKLKLLNLYAQQSSRFNLDGLIYREKMSDNITSGYMQIFRNGIIESVSNRMIAIDESIKELISSEFNQEIYEFCRNALGFYKQINISPPIILLISLLNFDGVNIRSGKLDAFSKVKPIDKANLLLPEVIINDMAVNLWTMLKSILDIIWNAANMPRCLEYDD